MSVIIEPAIDVLLAALCVGLVENVGRINVGLVFVGRRGQVHVGHVLEQGLSQRLVAGIAACVWHAKLSNS